MKFIFKIGEKIKEEAWPLYKQNLGLFLLMLVCLFIIQIMASQHSLILYIISILLSVFIGFTFIRFLLTIVNKKEFNLFSKNAYSFLSIWNFLKTYILYILTVGGLFLVFMFPYFYFILNGGILKSTFLFFIILVIFIFIEIYLSVRLTFALYFSVDKNQGAVKSIKESWNMTKGSFWIIFLKMLVIGLFSIVGFLAFIVGGLITYPMGMILIALLYRDFKNFKEGNIFSQVASKIEEVKEKSEEIKENIEEKIEDIVK